MRPAAGEDDEQGGAGGAAAKTAAREAEARATLVSLATAWGLAGVSAAHHAGHVLHLLVRSAGVLCLSVSEGGSLCLSPSKAVSEGGARVSLGGLVGTPAAPVVAGGMCTPLPARQPHRPPPQGALLLRWGARLALHAWAHRRARSFTPARAQGLHELAHTPVLVALGTPWFSGLLGAAALLGPGRT